MRFSKWLRQEAVDLLAISGRTRDEFAKEMGLAATSLQRWMLLHRVRELDVAPAGDFQRVTIESPVATADLAIVFPSGARLIGLSWQQVQELLGVSR